MTAPPKAQPDPAIEQIADAMSQWRLVFTRRYIGRNALEAVAPGLKHAHLDILEAVHRLSTEGEATVGAIAEVLNIDPSRSSRMVSELVDNGLLRRAVSQSDGRRAVVEWGEKTEGFFQAKRAIQRELLGQITTGWPQDDIERFSDLLSRFVEGLEASTRAGTE